MAETLGVVSSGMAVVSLAIQLAENIKKLRDFCQAVREAPDTVLRAIDELEILSLVLEDVDRSMQEQVFLDPRVKAIVLKSYRLCRSSGEAVKAVVVELEQSLVKGKKRGGFKTAMKKEHLQELGAKLDSAKSTLLLANQIYYQAIQTQKWESLEQDIYQLQSLQRYHHEEIKTQAITIQSTQDSESNCVAIQTLHHQRARRTRQYQRPSTHLSGSKYIAGMLGLVTLEHESSTMTTISLNLPTWISAKKFDINLKRSYQGWDASFRTYKRVPYEARVFDCCMDGDVEGLRHLFQSGAASPFEIDPDGRTPLHYAALYARPDACQFLLNQGADPNFPTFWQGKFSAYASYATHPKINITQKNEIIQQNIFRGFARYSTPLHFLVGSGQDVIIMDKNLLSHTKYQSKSFSNEDFYNTLQILVERGGSDSFQEDQYKRTAYHCYSGPEESLKWLRNHDELMIANMDPTEILKMALCITLFPGSKSEKKVRHLLPEGYITNFITPIKAKDNYTEREMYCELLFWLIMGWLETFSNCYDTTIFTDVIQIWEDLLIESLAAVSDVHILITGIWSLRKYTPLILLVELILKESVHFRDKALASWLTLLSKGGYDLEAYGQTEIDMHAQGISDWVFEFDPMKINHPDYEAYYLSEIRQIKFGPNPEDWHIEFEDCCVSNSFSADFWYWVEESEEEKELFPMIPGSWYDDNDEESNGQTALEVEK